ncbi:MAG TPA: SPASM domain-containing protein [Leptolyngbyaceae cyanobacterium M33_DOE_097]|nr:SPASM domain-containing protein [Leptolyngbyaceae cyanobacterium M33_DOE_097]
MVRTLFKPTNEIFTKEDTSLDKKPSIYAFLPQVKTLSLVNSYVLVNYESGSWVALDKEEYQELKTNKEKLQGLKGELLYRMGICSRNGEQKEFDCHSEYTEQLYFFEFAVSAGCNLSCKYCFADAQPFNSKANATKDIAELFIDRIAEHRIKTRTSIPYIIEFTGGEPLLNFKIIQHTIEYAESTYGSSLDVQFCLQSNATLLSNKIIKYLKDHKVGVGLSCDGFEAIQNKQRPFLGGYPSHQVVEDRIKKLHDLYPENRGGVITVITEEGVNYMPEIALYLYLNGFHELVFRPMQEVGRGAENCRTAPLSELYVQGLFNTLNSVITPIYKEKEELIAERYISLTFQHLLHPYRAFMCERTPCGGGRNICLVQPNGNVYSCNQSVGDDRFLLGNLKQVSFNEMLQSSAGIALSSRTLDKIEECRNCTFRSWCGSPCPLAVARGSENIMSKSSECNVLKPRYTRALSGLLEDEFDLEVVGKLAGFQSPVQWFVF